MMSVENQTGTTMRLIGNLTERPEPVDCDVQDGIELRGLRATPTIRRNKMERPNDWRPQATVV
jgi:hypothetical protein